MKSTLKMKASGRALLCLWVMMSLAVFYCKPVTGNNIRINGTVKVTPGTGDTLVLEFPLQWDNSWRDEFNWDAAWVFLKYKVGTGDWQHVNLSNKGHVFSNTSGNPVKFDCMNGLTGSSVVGLFVYRTELESGNPNIVCKLKCLKSALGGMDAAKFADNEAFIRVQGVEMVYVPYGAYYLGDGVSTNSLSNTDGTSILIDAEDARSVSTLLGQTSALAAAYPKGYKGFYMMKYELSQEQYVAFLNTLSYANQQLHVPGLTAMREGDYIFGPKAPDSRNGICVVVPSYSNQPVVFANNLNKDGKYAQDDDGKNVACNYLSINDMLAYCCWAGLRPMSELEYEKSCRPKFPDVAISGGYAWNSASVPTVLTNISAGGTKTEGSATANAIVNAGSYMGPVRCGIFATTGSTQQTAGASFWGGMELSGNLQELCYNAASGNVFNGTLLGDGTYSAVKWNNALTSFSVRGGGFKSAQDLLRVSDRTNVSNYLKNLTQHDSTVSFRGVRSIGIDVIPGSIIVKKDDGTANTAACPGIISHIETNAPASVSMSNIIFEYMWYMMAPGTTAWQVIPNENSETLNYNKFINAGTASVVYKFKRKAICPVGEGTSAELTLTVPNPSFTLLPNNVNLDGANASSSLVTSQAKQTSGGAFSWWVNGAQIADAANIKYTAGNSVYRADRGHYGNPQTVSGVYPVTCRYTIGGCSVDSILKVDVAPYNSNPCGGLTSVVDDAGKSYDVVKIGAQCWMQQSIDIGTLSAISSSDYWMYKKPGIQKWCSANATANCDKYGGLYEWWEVVCNGDCGGQVSNPDMTIAQGGYASMEEALKAAVPAVRMTPDGKRVRGICPAGWHLPTDEEWKQLEMFLGMSRISADKAYPDSDGDGWGRGNGIGTKMKAATPEWNGTSTKNAADEKDRFYGLPHGYRVFGGSGFDNFGGDTYCWFSTPYGTYAGFRGFYVGYTSVHRQRGSRSYGMSVRCVRN